MTPDLCLSCDELFALRGELYCQRCLDNREPPEPRGEDFRGREAQSYQAEQMDRVQREIKR